MEEKLKRKIRWAENYIKEYLENNDFDVYAALTGTEDKSTKIYIMCCNFIESIENVCTTFENDLNKIIIG